jgi:hypothetical protein
LEKKQEEKLEKNAIPSLYLGLELNGEALGLRWGQVAG